ncbi:PIG-L family deacetylase [Flavilitoribacter nigricans]|uniref:LmbE family protein n=1 Tax=Flavilitoribacter nigricans (strain ATCC 23147 / DSM 23189 / NBRC 102662 / NCIMB 1420 / SS-2) TaxID=1122177 RepID=A0A2D0N9L5_FLAN2|nr:PIG-L family deacetylase [Flavilitoribacter nigricans]PHN04839.1 LmbE family protein [Flavilitoribacter nigricans DSM 23189 = NBRC 102662]
MIRPLWRYGLVLLVLTIASGLFAQQPKKWTSADIHEAIKKLNFLGSALYVAAHPDDENTRLIAYLSNGVKAETAYLSMTRGDGGQNLVGPEIREYLGIIRTQELLGARRLDGGQQMFTRANDFGFSKHPDETLEIWNKDEVLSDVVWAIRKWQPDVIINRFWHEYEERLAGRMHGHHTASAMLSVKAFDLAADASKFPEQLKYVDTWQPRRLFFNTSWWFYGSEEAFKKVDKSDMLTVDVGVYYPIKGKSNTEIAAESRSMHKSQGFGSSGSRGSADEYIKLLKGDMPNGDHIFDGINTTWTRVEGGEPIGHILGAVENTFRYDEPHKSLTGLINAYKLIKRLPDGYWKRIKQAEIEEVIAACMALYAEAVSNDYSATRGQDITLDIELINRSAADVSLQSLEILPFGIDTTFDQQLENNKALTYEKSVELPKDFDLTNPYWLNEKSELGMYTVKAQELRGLPETPRELKVRFNLLVQGEPMSIERDVVYKRTDPVDGEVYRPFEITPPVYANIDNSVYVFAGTSPKPVTVRLKAGKADLKGTLELCHEEGWRAEPETVDFELTQKGEEQTFTFTLFPPEEQSEAMIVPLVKIGEESYTQAIKLIDYDHIPTQTVFADASVKVVKIDIHKAGSRVGYYMGAGDEIPASLEEIGYEVTLLDDRDMTPSNLQTFDAIIMGVRAYNTQDRLKFHQEKLLDYVKNGGTMIVQYNTSGRLKIPEEQLAPYPLEISRDRVTVEEANVRFLEPEHPVLNYPNEITAKDFDGWVQERGLYFPNKWDEAFTPVLSSNDPGEDPRDGGLLVAKYGEGYYIYTGYSWFRELPAGVPGAFRLFANMISIGKEVRP